MNIRYPGTRRGADVDVDADVDLFLLGDRFLCVPPPRFLGYC